MSIVTPEVEQPHDLASHVGGDGPPGRVDEKNPSRSCRDVDVRSEAADHQRRPGAVDASCCVVGGGADRVVLDAVVTEGGAGEQHVERRR